MNKKLSADLTQENLKFFTEHPEINKAGLVNKLIEEYRTNTFQCEKCGDKWTVLRYVCPDCKEAYNL